MEPGRSRGEPDGKFQFSLKTLFVATAVGAVVLGTYRALGSSTSVLLSFAILAATLWKLGSHPGMGKRAVACRFVAELLIIVTLILFVAGLLTPSVRS